MSDYTAAHSASQSAGITKRIDMLYGEACRQFPTYETLVFEHFCSRMIETFGGDEAVPEPAAQAFTYARSDYNYLSPSEIKAAREVNRSHGICSHGLTSDTCPCGCFEFTRLEVYEDSGPQQCDLMQEPAFEQDPDLVMSDEECEQLQEQWLQEEISRTSGPDMKRVSIHTTNAAIRSFLKFLWNVALTLSAARPR
ncbi:regulator [Pseudomonas savastanoi pv. nerii]|uniref:Regulator n=1 Tax=Pseudomonas savastanoi pv. nerii TaxID=360921 RepID=A0AB73R1L1_PSESS|nr:regulator [Pseudomonas savastanoi]PAB27273.1 regulator [Pseudomonas savastanoi pv. nerii]